MICAIAQAIFALSLVGMAALCAYIIRRNASRMRLFFHALGVWFTVPSIAIGFQVYDSMVPYPPLPWVLLGSAAFMAGSTAFSWSYVVRRVQIGAVAVPAIDELLLERQVHQAVWRARAEERAVVALRWCEEQESASG